MLQGQCCHGIVNKRLVDLQRCFQILDTLKQLFDILLLVVILSNLYELLLIRVRLQMCI